MRRPVTSITTADPASAEGRVGGDPAGPRHRGGEHRLEPPGRLLAAQPQRRRDGVAAGDERDGQQGGREERVGEAAPGLGDDVLHRLVVADEVGDVVADRPVGDAGEHQPGDPRQERGGARSRSARPSGVVSAGVAVAGPGRGGTSPPPRSRRAQQPVGDGDEGDRARREQAERPPALAGERARRPAPTPSARATTACPLPDVADGPQGDTETPPAPPPATPSAPHGGARSPARSPP